MVYIVRCGVHCVVWHTLFGVVSCTLVWCTLFGVVYSVWCGVHYLVLCGVQFGVVYTIWCGVDWCGADSLV